MLIISINQYFSKHALFVVLLYLALLPWKFKGVSQPEQRETLESNQPMSTEFNSSIMLVPYHYCGDAPDVFTDLVSQSFVCNSLSTIDMSTRMFGHAQRSISRGFGCGHRLRYANPAVMLTKGDCLTWEHGKTIHADHLC
uniref:Uncharacterized protein n=1 Tax=Candidatus Kentrum sp. TUN TaxID=2126343 RepID=A0A450ZEI9_9GAMM|nr:MAG: hypothetical protein BECKTUN1418D_GA0071000_100340 [Candidatus Kentron sp. TUN]VFK52135.1 MAG: hypothetical protein BECKTUN1418E_GA0071001_100734 [Candidatus Kentron sp. TUN]VFK52180.1 MAG: hypothetical protein BECKTUN1418F_GA0071002_100534 [Candidatus Kentron sp. TUN]